MSPVKPPCRLCGAPCAPRAMRALCPACGPTRCRDCDVPLPAGRATPRCSVCYRRREREGWVRLACRLCGQPCERNPSHGLCAACRRSHCSGCEAPLPPGRARGDCTACWRDLVARRRTPRRCRVCQAPVAHGARRDFCPAHAWSFCSQCSAALPGPHPDNDHRCHACRKAHNDARLARPGRRCALCPRPAAGKSKWCLPCSRQEYLARRQALLFAVDRTCFICRAPLAPGRLSARCTACERARRRAKQRSVPDRRCATCRQPIPATRQSYCKNCDRTRVNWQQACERGDTLALMVRPHKKYRKWQKAGP